MSQPKGVLDKYFRLFLLVAIFAAVIYLIVRNIGVFGNILLVAIGFGAMILVHEFGHFLIAKLSDIKVEAFSIGFPPVLFGIRKTEKGYCVRILPELFAKKGDSEEGQLSFTVGKSTTPGETEYRIGLIPFGGFVKMLGQEDVGSAKTTDDPRSYANKPVGTRMAVITSGVLFNAISAVGVFMIVFLIGIKLSPAVVGSIVPGSPAARAGLKPGDEIIEIAGKKDNLDFGDIKMAAALSDVNEAVKLKVRHKDGSTENFAIVAEQLPAVPMKGFGIGSPQSLTIAKVSDANVLLGIAGLLADDRIRSVDGKNVHNHWGLEEIVENALVPQVIVVAERTDSVSHRVELVESRLRLNLNPAQRDVKSESDLSHICSIVPRLRITNVLKELSDTKPSLEKKDIILATAEPYLEKDDIILAVGDIENPTFKELRDVVEQHEGKILSVKVLRKDANEVENALAVTVVPKRIPEVDRVMIGIGVALDAEHPVVAKTITVEAGPEALAIPRGAVITAVDKVKVASFYDVISQIKASTSRNILIDYRLGEKTNGGVTLKADTAKDSIAVKSTFAEPIPFAELKQLYKAAGPINAIKMGYRKTFLFIAQTYITLKRLVSGLVSPKELMGPVGIVTFSYRIVAEQPIIYYVYFLGLISACVAVFNFLPLPPLDGGHIVLLLVEKIKGSALSERTQAIVAYAGWVLIGSFFLYVTFNDIVRSFFIN